VVGVWASVGGGGGRGGGGGGGVVVGTPPLPPCGFFVDPFVWGEGVGGRFFGGGVGWVVDVLRGGNWWGWERYTFNFNADP